MNANFQRYAVFGGAAAGAAGLAWLLGVRKPMWLLLAAAGGVGAVYVYQLSHLKE